MATVVLRASGTGLTPGEITRTFVEPNALDGVTGGDPGNTVAYKVTLGRLPNSGASGISSGCPIAPNIATAIQSAGFSLTGDVRLFNLADDSEILMAPPVKLKTADLPGAPTILLIQVPPLDVPGIGANGLACELRWGTQGVPYRRPAFPVTETLLGWCLPTLASDFCASGITGDSIRPYATRGTLPTSYTILDDDYVRAHEYDYTVTETEAATLTGDVVWSFGRNATAYNMAGITLRRGIRIGAGIVPGTTVTGHEYVRRAVLRYNRYLRKYASAGLKYYSTSIPHNTLEMLPYMYWLTGMEDYRKLAITAARAARYGNRVSDTYGIYGSEPRNYTPSLLGTLVALRMGGVATESNPTADDATFGTWGAGAMDSWWASMKAELQYWQRLTGQPFAGSLGGNSWLTATPDPADAGRPDAAPAGVPTVVTFQAGFFLRYMRAAIRAAELGQISMSNQTMDEMKTFFALCLNYYIPKLMTVTGGKAWAYRIPQTNNDGAGKSPDAALNGWWVSACMAAYKWTNNAAFQTAADDLMGALQARRLPGGSIAGTGYDNWAQAAVRKNFDEAYDGFEEAVADRAA